MGVFAECMTIYHVCIPRGPGGQKRVYIPLALGLQS